MVEICLPVATSQCWDDRCVTPCPVFQMLSLNGHPHISCDFPHAGSSSPNRCSKPWRDRAIGFSVCGQLWHTVFSTRPGTQMCWRDIWWVSWPKACMNDINWEKYFLLKQYYARDRVWQIHIFDNYPPVNNPHQQSISLSPMVIESVYFMLQRAQTYMLSSKLKQFSKVTSPKKKKRQKSLAKQNTSSKNALNNKSS